MISSRRGVLFAGLASGLVALANRGALAQAQAILRSQTRIVNDAIQRQVQAAFRPTLTVRGAGGPVAALEASDDGAAVVLIAAQGGARVWDLRAGRETARPSVGRIRLAALSRDAKLLAVSGDAPGVSLWEGIGGRDRGRLEGVNGAARALAVSPDGATVAVALDGGTIEIRGVDDKSRRATIRAGGAVAALAFTPSGDRLASGGADGSVVLWEASSGTRVWAGSTGGAAVTRLAAVDDDRIYSGSGDGSVRLWKTGSDAPIATIALGSAPVKSLSARSDGSAAALVEGGRPVLIDAGGRGKRELADAPAGEVGVAAPSGSTAVLTAGADGRGRLWDAKGKVAAQLILTSGGWSVVDQTGRYDGSDGGVADLSRRTEREEFEMSGFAESYYEPGLVAKLLWAPNEILTSDAKPIDAGIPAPPVVEVGLDPAAPSAPGPVRIVVTAQSRDGGVGTITLYQNGKAVSAKRIVAKQKGEGDKTPTVVTYETAAVGGENRFRAVAWSAEGKVESAPAEIAINVPAPPAPPPTLHVVVVGINQYANPALTLNYAVADARGVVEWAKSSQGKGLFGKVDLREIYDTGANRPAIRAVFADLAKADPNDVVLIYLAGHGEISQGSWHFLPTEFGRDLALAQAGDTRAAVGLRESFLKAVTNDGISGDELRDEIASIGAGHVMVLIDACKSGGLRSAFDNGADRKKLNSLSRQAGVFMLAATGKDQLAAEIDTIGHGVFTYTVLEALRGAADRSPADGAVTAKEVLAYAADRVPLYAQRYADNVQFPTAFSQGSDFAVGRPAKASASKGKPKKS